MTFKNGGVGTAAGTSETVTTSSVIAMGTCVETLDSAGAAVVSTVTTVGNFAICHFLIYTATASSNSGAYTAGYTGTTNWGLTTYMTATQWFSSSGSTAGAGVIGNTLNMSTGGTGITSGTNGLVLDPATTTNFAESTVYNQEWYQPLQTTTYGASALRRYSGAYNGATADKVKPYCVSQRLISESTTKAGITAGSTATLAGASALAAGAIAFGVAALAM